jgi:hypothetical protein
VERTVRQYVERRKRELGLAEPEMFVPQSYRWGVEAQIDWYEAYADLDGERIKLQVFSMRSMAIEFENVQSPSASVDLERVSPLRKAPVAGLGSSL